MKKNKVWKNIYEKNKVWKHNIWKNKILIRIKIKYEKIKY